MIEPLQYQRCRFTAVIPVDRLYTRDHYWMIEEASGLWRVGLTAWAVRMLGDFVECRFDVAEGEAVRLHQTLGILEAFKAVAEIRCVATGAFAGGNPTLEKNVDAISQDCQGTGWLYRVRGEREADACDANRYRALLDETIDAMRGSLPPDCV